MTLGIMLLDMLKLRRLPKSRHIPIKIPQPFVNRRIPTSYIFDITLEMLNVNWIKPYNCGVQADVGFGDVLAKIVGIGVFREVFFHAIKRVEEWVYGGFVRGLSGRESRFVDAIVDVIVGPVVGCFNFGLEILGEKVNLFVFLGNDVVEFGVKHADDLAGLDVDERLAESMCELCSFSSAYLIAHNLVLFDVVESRHCEAAFIVGADIEIDVSQMSKIWVDRIWCDIVSGNLLIRFRKAPTWKLRSIHQ